MRFSGFGKEEDEWVNMKSEVRERSIPLDPSECQKVKVGDLVLCFQVISEFVLSRYVFVGNDHFGFTKTFLLAVHCSDRILAFQTFSVLMAYLQERENFALYCDAHIVGIERKLHDLNACKCIFIVRYEYDDSEVNSQ